MFRSALFLTSALAAVSSAAVAAQHSAERQLASLPKGAVVASSIDRRPVAVILPSGVITMASGQNGDDKLPPSQPITFNNLSKDRNAQFLSWYGYEVSSYYFYSSCPGHYPSSGCSVSSGYTRVAIPIVGRGTAVSKIRVPQGYGAFNIALYTDAGNKPGQPIQGASASSYGTGSGYCCTQLVSVSIPETTLASGTQYWLVETGTRETERSNRAIWLAEDTDYTGDGKMLTQYHKYYWSNGHTRTNYTSGWESTTDNWTEPAAKVY